MSASLSLGFSFSTSSTRGWASSSRPEAASIAASALRALSPGGVVPAPIDDLAVGRLGGVRLARATVELTEGELHLIIVGRRGDHSLELGLAGVGTTRLGEKGDQGELGLGVVRVRGDGSAQCLLGVILAPDLVQGLGELELVGELGGVLLGEAVEHPSPSSTLPCLP